MTPWLVVPNSDRCARGLTSCWAPKVSSTQSGSPRFSRFTTGLGAHRERPKAGEGSAELEPSSVSRTCEL